MRLTLRCLVDPYIELFNDYQIVRRAISGKKNLERQQAKIIIISNFFEKNEMHFKELVIKDEFIEAKTSRCVINIAVTPTGSILFIKVNLNTNYLIKPKRIIKIHVLFNELAKCIDVKDLSSNETLTCPTMQEILGNSSVSPLEIRINSKFSIHDFEAEVIRIEHLLCIQNFIDNYETLNKKENY